MIPSATAPRLTQTERPPASSAWTAVWMNSSLPGMWLPFRGWRDFFLFGVQFIDLSMKRPSANPELFRRGGYISVRCSQGLQNKFALGFVDIERAGFFTKRFRRRNSTGQRCAGCLPNGWREIANTDFGSGRHDDAVLNRGP